MQLLERNDKQKWTVWTAKGQGQYNIEEYLDNLERGQVDEDGPKMTERVQEFFNIVEAKGYFENMFT